MYYLLSLCPILALSDSVINAIGIGVTAIITATLSAALASIIARWGREEFRTAACVLIVAAVVGCLMLLMNAWFHELHRSLGLFLPLVMANHAILSRVKQSATVPRQVVEALQTGANVALLLLLLGISREFVGRGSLMHEAGLLLGAAADNLDFQVFRADMGFLLAALPPGAFIAAGLLLAAKNWCSSKLSRREPSTDTLLTQSGS